MLSIAQSIVLKRVELSQELNLQRKKGFPWLWGDSSEEYRLLTGDSNLEVSR